MRLKVGDRVKCIEEFDFAPVGSIGTVKQNDYDGGSILVVWDENVDGHDGNGICKDGYGEYTCIRYLELNTEKPKYVFSGLKFIESEGYDDYLIHKKWVDKCDGVAIINGFALAEDEFKYSVTTESWRKEVK
jgi:hypothetical protein